jgi:hypothetical protein
MLVSFETSPALSRLRMRGVLTPKSQITSQCSTYGIYNHRRRHYHIIIINSSSSLPHLKPCGL